MKKIPNRYTPFVFVFLVATPLSGCLSCINTFRAEGWTPHFINHWLFNWMVGFAMVYPLALFFVRIARKIVARIVEQH